MISRTRLELAAWFGVSLLAGIGLLAAVLLAHLHDRRSAALDDELTHVARGLAKAIELERREHPGMAVEDAVAEEIGEWYDGRDTLAVYDGEGRRIGLRGPPLGLPATGFSVGGDRPLAVGERGRVPAPPTRWAAFRPDGAAGLRVVAARSTGALRAETRALGGQMLISIPLVLLASLVAGYVLAGRALTPLRTMARAIDEIGPDHLDRRIPVPHPAGELGALASRFNDLLDRLEGARHRNREFLARVAHQLRTPITVARGESALGLDRPRDGEDYREILGRIHRATDQMSRRVDDLFLLASAESDERPPLGDVVELDGLALECTDLMRGRAAATGHPLGLERVEPGEAVGNEALLREALVELLENALRHSARTRPVAVSAYRVGDTAQLHVSSHGDPVPGRGRGADRHTPPGGGGEERPPARPRSGADPEEPVGDERHLGLGIVEWIARAHGGELRYAHVDGVNTYSVLWPA